MLTEEPIPISFERGCVNEYILFTAGNCPRCKIAKRFMDERVIDYDEADIKGGGMETFRQFYKVNRDSIIRTKEGIEFLVFTDGATVR